MENEKREITLTYESPHVMRILSTHFFDFFISLVFAFIALIGTFAIIPNLSFYSSALEKRNEELVSSSLYVKNSGSVTPLLNVVDADTTLSYNEKSQKLDEAMTEFFNVYLANDLPNGAEIYLSLKVEALYNNEHLFSNTGERVLTNPDYDEAYYSFYVKAYQEKALGYLSYNPVYSSSRDTIIRTVSISIGLTFLLSFLIFYTIIPLCFSRGKRTLGMLLNKTALVGKDAFSCSYKRFLCHSLFEIIFIIIASIPAFLIPLGISITMIIVRKGDHQSLTDYVTGTYIVSAKDKKIYRNVYEYLESERRANNGKMIEDKDVKLL